MLVEHVQGEARMGRDQETRGHRLIALGGVRCHDDAMVEIVDDGPAIPLTKTVGEGSGLGLDIARRIVKVRHKGEIRFESRPGETCFEARLPLCGIDS